MLSSMAGLQFLPENNQEEGEGCQAAHTLLQDLLLTPGSQSVRWQL
jgi:hypothetical protein